MPLQEFVEGDRVAYLAKKAAGYEACCGNVPERTRKQRIQNRGGMMYLIRLGPRGPGLASAARPRAESASRQRLRA